MSLRRSSDHDGGDSGDALRRRCLAPPVQSNPTRKRVCDAFRSGSGDDPPGMDESAKGYVRRGQSLAVRDDQKVMDAPGTNAGRG